MFFTATSPIIVDGMAVVQLGGRGSGEIVAFDLNTGAEKWKWAGEGPAYASPVLMTVEGVKHIVTMTERELVGVGVADGKLLWKFAPGGGGGGGARAGGEGRAADAGAAVAGWEAAWGERSTP
jgi:outer membrane protein assembly factor BamB